MKTPEEYLDEVAKEMQWASKEFLFKYGSVEQKLNLFKEAMRRYAEDACKEQKQICADYAETKTEEYYVGDINGTGQIYANRYIIDKESILNAPSPIKP